MTAQAGTGGPPKTGGQENLDDIFGKKPVVDVKVEGLSPEQVRMLVDC